MTEKSEIGDAQKFNSVLRELITHIVQNLYMHEEKVGLVGDKYRIHNCNKLREILYGKKH